MLLDTDGLRSGGGAGGADRLDNPKRSRTRSRAFSAVSRVVRCQAPSQIRHALPEPLQPATCRAVLTRLPAAVLPGPALVGRRGAPAVARFLPVAGFPSDPAISDELGVAGLVAVFVGVPVREVLLAAPLAAGRPAGRRAGGGGEGIAGRGVVTGGGPQGAPGGPVVTDGDLERLAGLALAGRARGGGCALLARGDALGLAHGRLGVAQLVAGLVALRADLRFEPLEVRAPGFGPSPLSAPSCRALCRARAATASVS